MKTKVENTQENTGFQRKVRSEQGANENLIVGPLTRHFLQAAGHPAYAPAVPNNVQPKLEIGKPDDPLEAEADQVAERVVSGGTPVADIQSKRENEEKLQRVIYDEEKDVPNDMVMAKTENGQLHMKPDIQREADGSMNAGPRFQGKLSSRSGFGNPLSQSVQREMDSGFGRSMAHVRVHNDSNADQLSRSINARAFTHKNDIYFKSGAFDTGSTEGKKLLAHEMTHTLQQGDDIQRTPKKYVPINTYNKIVDLSPQYRKHYDDENWAVDYVVGIDRDHVSISGLKGRQQPNQQHLASSIKGAINGLAGYNPGAFGTGEWIYVIVRNKNSNEEIMATVSVRSQSVGNVGVHRVSPGWWTSLVADYWRGWHRRNALGKGDEQTDWKDIAAEFNETPEIGSDEVFDKLSDQNLDWGKEGYVNPSDLAQARENLQIIYDYMMQLKDSLNTAFDQAGDLIHLDTIKMPKEKAKSGLGIVFDLLLNVVSLIPAFGVIGNIARFAKYANEIKAGVTIAKSTKGIADNLSSMKSDGGDPHPVEVQQEKLNKNAQTLMDARGQLQAELTLIGTQLLDLKNGMDDYPNIAEYFSSFEEKELENIFSGEHVRDISVAWEISMYASILKVKGVGVKADKSYESKNFPQFEGDDNASWSNYDSLAKMEKEWQEFYPQTRDFASRKKELENPYTNVAPYFIDSDWENRFSYNLVNKEKYSGGPTPQVFWRTLKLSGNEMVINQVLSNLAVWNGKVNFNPKFALFKLMYSKNAPK